MVEGRNAWTERAFQPENEGPQEEEPLNRNALV